MLQLLVPSPFFNTWSPSFSMFHNNFLRKKEEKRFKLFSEETDDGGGGCSIVNFNYVFLTRKNCFFEVCLKIFLHWLIKNRYGKLPERLYE